MQVNFSSLFQIGSESCARSLSSDFRPSLCMFALNFILKLKSAMHDGVIWLKIPKITFNLHPVLSSRSQPFKPELR